jgi:pyruvate dehydrogenase E2 component (dihydrolipoamide acetyltransferase)
MEKHQLDLTLVPSTEIPLKGIRRTIATRLGAIWQQAVHVTLHKTIDVTAFYERKAELAFSLLDHLLHGLVLTLQEERFRSFNAHFDGGMLKTYASVNLGLATDHPRGLMVPIVHRAEGMGLAEFVLTRKDVVSRALTGKMKPGDMENGTFTVSNLGTMGIDAFTPILNPPQTAILGLGRTRFETVSWSWGEEPDRRAMLPLSLTVDHRVVDGADAARFLLAVEANMHRSAGWRSSAEGSGENGA